LHGKNLKNLKKIELLLVQKSEEKTRRFQAETMAMRFDYHAAHISSFASTCRFVETQTLGASGPLLCGSDRGAHVVVKCVRNGVIRRRSGDLFVAGISREQTGLTNLLTDEGRRYARVGSLAADSSCLLTFEHWDAEPRGLNPNDALRPVLNPRSLQEDEDDNCD